MDQGELLESQPSHPHLSLKKDERADERQTPKEVLSRNPREDSALL